MIAVYETEDLKQAFEAVFGDSEFLLMFDMQDSYLWQWKKEILEAINDI